jgi:hypothetical protein
MRSALAFLCIHAVFALAAGAASAVEVHPHAGSLPGFPAIRGAIPVLGSASALGARERLVDGAFATARAQAEHRAVEPNELGSVGCEAPFFYFSQDVCYQGGPVLRKPTVHLIFWQGKPGGIGEAKVGKFPEGPGNSVQGPGSYIGTVAQYFTDVAHDSGLETNVFAVDPQYGSETFGNYEPGVYEASFDKATDVALITEPFPVLTGKESEECSDFLAGVAEGPCVLDRGIQQEVEKVAEEKKWPTGLDSVFVLFTPPGVGSCAPEGCAYKQYCAYHGDFGGNGFTPGGQTVYANMPFVGEVSGCDSGVHPNTPAAEDDGADAVLDAASHELGEAITDPLGSQCRSKATTASECEPFSWTDAIGQEIADKCLPPESTIAGVYGEPLGEVEVNRPATDFNQLIDGHRYWTQRVWSNAATEFQGGCVQRMVHTELTPPSGARATVPVAFDGSASGSAGDPVVYWEWEFGDEATVGAPEATVSHTYAKSGVYGVTLTAFDLYGNSNTHSLNVEVGAAPSPAPTPVVPTNTTTVTVTTPAPALEHLTLTQLAAKLGLPPDGKRLSAVGRIVVGHAQCPPACAVSARLEAAVSTPGRERRSVKQRRIGSLRLTIAAKDTHAIALALNATGRVLLRREHSLKATLTVIVEDAQGASWQVVRRLTLIDTARAAGRTLSELTRRR